MLTVLSFSYGFGSGRLLGLTWDLPGLSCGPLGGSWRLLGGLLGLAWATWAPRGLGASLGPCWGFLVALGASLGVSWELLGLLGRLLVPLGASLGPCWGFLVALGASLGVSWDLLGPSCGPLGGLGLAVHFAVGQARAGRLHFWVY